MPINRVPTKRSNVALLTEIRYAATEANPEDAYLHNILRDDRLLEDALASLGVTSTRVDWARKDIRWEGFQFAVFRTTWDYFHRFEEFSNWIKQVEKLTQFINSPSIVRWNMDKHYLADLQLNGIPIVPSHFLERGDRCDLATVLSENAWTEAVIKPCVSGGARHTYRVSVSNFQEIEYVANQILEKESMVVQPFLPNIMQEGEDSLMMFDGCYSHAVRKLAKAGDFRVQDDHGGTVEKRIPTKEQIELAERTIAVCEQELVYARVDMVRDEAGKWLIMELELVEPELWLRLHPPAAQAFAKAIVKRF